MHMGVCVCVCACIHIFMGTRNRTFTTLLGTKILVTYISLKLRWFSTFL